jgi:hypothetical protein
VVALEMEGKQYVLAYEKFAERRKARNRPDEFLPRIARIPRMGKPSRLIRDDSMVEEARPHPDPLPQEREQAIAALGKVIERPSKPNAGVSSPSPWGQNSPNKPAH